MSIIPTGRVWELTRSLFPHVSPVLLWLLFITLVPEDLKIKASKSQMLIPKVSLWNTYLRLPMLNFATGGPFVEIVVIISIQPPWCQNSAKFHSSSFSTLSKIPSFRPKKNALQKVQIIPWSFPQIHREFPKGSTKDTRCELWAETNSNMGNRHLVFRGDSLQVSPVYISETFSSRNGHRWTWRSFFRDFRICLWIFS